MVCHKIEGKTYCASWEESTALDRETHGDITDKILDTSIEAGQGIGDSLMSLYYFPSDVVKYVTCTDQYLGQRREWDNFGACEEYYQPALNVVHTVNTLGYGGADLLLGHIPYKVFNEWLGADIPYFSPPPGSVREISRDLSMGALMAAMPAAEAGITRARLKTSILKTEHIAPKIENVVSKAVTEEISPKPPAEIVATETPKPNNFHGLKKAFEKFLDFYQKADAKHHYWTGAATAGAAYVGGDIIAQLILSSKQPFDLINISSLLGLSLYYGWESPLTLAKIESTIKIQNIDIRPNLKSIVDSSRKAMAGENVIANLKLARGEAISILKNRRGQILRPLAYMVGISPFWTMRHMAILNLMHSIYATPTIIIGSTLAMWASTAPILSCLEYVIQNKIPLRYRFLAQASVITAWHTIASLATLLE